jgi:hypothetical protein
MFENGFDAGYVIRHPVFLVTFIVAIPAWIVAFAGQCAAEAQYTSELSSSSKYDACSLSRRSWVKPTRRWNTVVQYMDPTVRFIHLIYGTN